MNKRLTFHTAILFTLIVCLTIALQLDHFGGENFREDEILTVHSAGMRNIQETVLWMANDIHPPLWRVIGDVWVDTFGIDEGVVRHLSVLFTALTLAFTFRLGKDLLDEKLGLLATFILGIAPFFFFYSYEFRPYPPLITIAVALQVPFLRWLRHQNFKYALIYVVIGIAGLYTHYFAPYVIVAQVVFMLVFVRWDKERYLRAIGLWVAIGLSFFGWLVPFLKGVLVQFEGGIYYSLPTNFAALQLIYERMNLVPEAIGAFLLLLGVAMPFVGRVPSAWRSNQKPSSLFRFDPAWRKWYALVMVVAILVIAFTANLFVSNVTARNLVILLPFLALILATAVYTLPWQAGMVILLMLGVTSWGTYRRYEPNGAYQEILAFMQPNYQTDSRIITEVQPSWRWLTAVVYSLLDRLPGDPDKFDMVHLVDEGDWIPKPNPPDELVNFFVNVDSTSLEEIEGIIGTPEQLWHVQGGRQTAYHAEWVSWLEREYVPVQSEEWLEGYDLPYAVTEYRRIPDDVGTVYRFGEDISLQAWELTGEVEVQPCETIELESWWRTETTPDINFSMTMVIVDDNGQGVANIDGAPSPTLTKQWQADQFYRDVRHLTIPCDLPAGEYPLLLGLYDPETVVSEAVFTAEDIGVGEQGYLTTIIVGK